MSLPANVYEIVEHQETKFNYALSDENINWARESGFAIQRLQENDFLNKTAWKNPDSLKNAIINVASIGITLNPASKYAYLVPRDGAVCLDISYMGLLHLAEESGAIVWAQAKVVYSNDTYENTGIDSKPNHIQSTFGDKGNIVGAYCTVKLPSGDYLTEEMDMAQINKIKSTSKAKNGPWRDWEHEMIRKAVTKRASKYWPKGNSNRLSQAVELLNENEGGFEEEKDVTPPPGCLEYEEVKQAFLECETLKDLKNKAKMVKKVVGEMEQEELKTIWFDCKNKLEGVYNDQ